MAMKSGKSDLQKSLQVTSSRSTGPKLSWYTFNCALLAANGSFLCGMDAGIITTTISQPMYLDYFKPYSADIAGAVVSALPAGAFIGLVFAGWAADKWGRKQTIKFAAIWALAGGVIQTISVHVGMLVLGRIVAGFAVGILFTITPIYTAEIAPKNKRGLVSGLHAQFMGFGYAFANWVGFACSYADSHIQWRLPIAIQCIPALILLAGIHLLPYSPRWLLAQGRDDEALAVFKKLHHVGDGTAEQDEEILCRFHEMQEWILHDTPARSVPRVIWSKTARKRLFLATLGRLMQPLAGADVVGYCTFSYNIKVRDLIKDDALFLLDQSIIYRDMGIKGHTVTLFIAVCGMAAPAANLVALVCMDRYSRKKVLWICCLAMACNMALIMGFTARYGESGNKVGQVAWIAFIHMFFSGYNSVQSVYTPEILNQTIRARGSSIALCVSHVISIIITQISPRAFASIGYKYYSVFICTNLVGAVIIFTTFVETRGRSLEEISRLFGETPNARLSTTEPSAIVKRAR